MAIEFTPKACEPSVAEDEHGNTIEMPAKFTGTVSLRNPNFDERYEYMEKAGFALNADGEIDQSISQLGAIRRMARFAANHVKAVNIKKVSDGTEYKTLDELKNDPECDAIVVEVAMLCLRGVKPSKN